MGPTGAIGASSTRVSRTAAGAGSAAILLVGHLVALRTELRFEAGETACPAILAADDRRVDEEALPAPRRAQASPRDAGGVGITQGRLFVRRRRSREIDGNQVVR